jgi:hypothetical protein
MRPRAARTSRAWPTALLALAAAAGCSSSADDSDGTGCVPEDCAMRCRLAGYSASSCGATGLCECSGVFDAGADADGDLDTPAETEPDGALDVLPDDAEPPDVAYDTWYPDYAYDAYDTWYPDYAYDAYDTWYPDYAYDAYDTWRPDYVYDAYDTWRPDYAYDASDSWWSDDSMTAACADWSAWYCTPGTLACSATCGDFAVSCSGGTCECRGSGSAMSCPIVAEAGCTSCEKAVDMRCCPF